MFDLAWSEIALIAVVALVVIGPKDLPEAVKGVARSIQKLRRMAGEFQSQVDEVAKDAGVQELRQSINEIRNFDLKGQIEKAVDREGDLRSTFSQNPLSQDALSQNPLAPDTLPPAPAWTPPETMQASDAPAFVPPGVAMATAPYVTRPMVPISEPVSEAVSEPPPAFVPPALAASPPVTAASAPPAPASASTQPAVVSPPA